MARAPAVGLTSSGSVNMFEHPAIDNRSAKTTAPASMSRMGSTRLSLLFLCIRYLSGHGRMPEIGVFDLLKQIIIEHAT
jgi:hypothetical protein